MGQKKFLVLIKFLVKKLFGVKKNVVPKKLLVRNKLWVRKKNLVKKNILSKKKLVQKYWVRKYVGSRKFFGPKTFFGPKNWRVWIFVCSNSLFRLYGAYVPYLTFQLDLEPFRFKQIFGEGSCCCSCDRGKTKSTPSLKTKPGLTIKWPNRLPYSLLWCWCYLSYAALHVCVGAALKCRQILIVFCKGGGGTPFFWPLPNALLNWTISDHLSEKNQWYISKIDWAIAKLNLLNFNFNFS